MNAVFDLNRWLLYTKKHWVENKRRYLLSLVAIGGSLVLWFSFVVFIISENPVGTNIQFVTYYVGIFITGCLYASVLFAQLGSSSKAVHFLLLPASAFEKLLTTILFGVVLFFIGYTLVYYLVDFSMISLSNGIAASAEKYKHVRHMAPTPVINVFVAQQEGDNFYLYFLLAYLGIQSLFLLGSVYFLKNSFIKTMVSVLVVFLFLMFFVHNVMHLFVPAGEFFEPFSIYRIFNAAQGEVAVLLPGWLDTLLLFLFKYSLAPVCWLATYYRLKEKEVNA